MNEKKLLASVALFSELYDCDRDIYDVIAEFIRATIVLNSKKSFNSTGCTQLVEETFGFKLPEAVIKTTLKKRLKGSGELDLNRGTYFLTNTFNTNIHIERNISQNKDDYREITRRLISSVKAKSAIKITEIDEEKIIKCFNEFLLNNNKKNEYFTEITHFIISNQNDAVFKENLTKIEEGLIVYAGIKYSANINDIGSWEGDLTIFLDTEILFRSVGYDGILHKKLFNDFHGLTLEVNNQKRKRGKIQLRYFDEVRNEVEDFFYAAEKIVQYQSSVPPHRTAMLEIINGCKSPSDVIAKKVKFYDDLRRLRIEPEESENYYDNQSLNLESSETVDRLTQKFNHRSEENKYNNLLKLFTKINVLRKGESKKGIEQIKAIFLTGNRLTHAIAWDESVKEHDAIPFATDIDFMTEKLWFKLKKGFGGDQNTPISFDVVTKAQIVLSSQISNQVSDNYRILKDRFEKGEISKQEAVLSQIELRHKLNKPEELTVETVDDSLDFLRSDFIDEVLREKVLLEKSSSDGKEAAKQLQAMTRIRKEEKLKPYRKNAKRIYSSLIILIYAVCVGFIISSVSLLKSNSDTLLSIIFGSIGVLSILFTMFKRKNIGTHIWRISKRYYRRKCQEIVRKIDSELHTGT